MRTLIHFVVVLTACGSSKPTPKQEPSSTIVAQPANATAGDECDQVMAKLRFRMDEVVKESGDGTITTDDLFQSLVENCRKPESRKKNARFNTCVLAAADELAVRACVKAHAEISVEAAEPKDERPEAERYLVKLAKNAKTIWQAESQFTIGKVGPTPGTKCGCPKACPFDQKLWWDHPIWSEIEFMVTADSHYQYTYESDGKTFKATAIGDLDCDGKPGIWTLTGVGRDDGATTILSPPPKGTL